MTKRLLNVHHKLIIMGEAGLRNFKLQQMTSVVVFFSRNAEVDLVYMKAMQNGYDTISEANHSLRSYITQAILHICTNNKII